MNDDRCRVCNGPLERDRATCNQCGEDFHLALRVDSATTDCGEAWIDDEVQALVFGCNTCLGRTPPAAVPERRRYARRTGMRASAVARTRRRSDTGAGPRKSAGGAS